jgi:hypothetical protein
MIVDISQILVSKPILNSVKLINPEFNIKQSNLKLDSNAGPFALSRIHEYDPTRISTVLEKEPIKVSFVFENNGKSYYTIEDGRHRYAQALAIGLTTIKVWLV